MNNPEIKAQIHAMHRKHMESWISMKLPALGGKTPLQSVKTIEGKKMVVNLHADFERTAGVSGDRDFE